MLICYSAGKPCPNTGCSGKLTLLSCRGHCGYPVTHFWRHVNNSVFFQAKGYHDHPRPEVKSLSDKGRHAFSKQLRQSGVRSLSKCKFSLLQVLIISQPSSQHIRRLFLWREGWNMIVCSVLVQSRLFWICMKSTNIENFLPAEFSHTPFLSSFTLIVTYLMCPAHQVKSCSEDGRYHIDAFWWTEVSCAPPPPNLLQLLLFSLILQSTCTYA